MSDEERIDFDKLAEQVNTYAEKAGHLRDEAAEAGRDDTTFCKVAGVNVRADCDGFIVLHETFAKCSKHKTAQCPQYDKDEERMRYLQRVGFGLRYVKPDRKKLFGNQPDAAPAITGVNEYLDNLQAAVDEGKGIVLLGGTGIGKTFAFACIALMARKHNIQCLCVYAPELFEMTIQAIGSDADEVRGKLATIETVPLLLLDDFGSEYGKDFALSRFNSLIDARHRNYRATCVASNLSLAEINKLAGYERAVSRWYENCSGRIFDLGEGVADLRKAR